VVLPLPAKSKDLFKRNAPLIAHGAHGPQFPSFIPSDQRPDGYTQFFGCFLWMKQTFVLHLSSIQTMSGLVKLFGRSAQGFSKVEGVKKTSQSDRMKVIENHFH
jgi:hypothetical protein